MPAVASERQNEVSSGRRVHQYDVPRAFEDQRRQEEEPVAVLEWLSLMIQSC